MTECVGAKLSRPATGAVILAVLLLVLSPVPSIAQDSDTGKTTVPSGKTILNEGVQAFEQSDYSTALTKFRELTVHPNDPGFAPYQGDAHFWIAKSALALNRLDEAQRNLEYFLANYPNHPAFPEASYLKGRLLYLQNDYQSAIQVFQEFIKKFPDSPYIANAYYWSGECLYALGQFEAARKLFAAVVQNYPSSYRVEAASYKLALIDQKKREEELLKLLQWSHEESLRALDEYQKKEKTYQEAIAAYQEKLAGNPSDALSAEVARLGNQVKDLRSQLAQRDNTIEQLKQQVDVLIKQLGTVSASSGGSAQGGQDAAAARAGGPAAGASGTVTAAQDQANRSSLLDLKNQALELKQSLFQAINAAGGSVPGTGTSAGGAAAGTSSGVQPSGGASSGTDSSTTGQGGGTQ